MGHAEDFSEKMFTPFLRPMLSSMIRIQFDLYQKRYKIMIHRARKSLQQKKHTWRP